MKFRNLKLAGAAAIAVGIVSVATAAPVVLDDFTFTGALSANGWAAHSGAGTQPPDTTTGLTFTGHPGSGIGNAANFDNNGEDVNRTFAPITSGPVYFGFLLNSSALNAGYFAMFSENPMSTTFKGRVFQVADPDTTGDYELGLSWQGGSASNVTNLNLAFNTTYLVVLKYNIVGTAGTDDELSLFVIPTSVPGTEPAPTIGPIVASADGGTDFASGVGSIAFRQYNAAQRQVVDAVRVGTTWNDAVLSAPPSVATLSSAWSQGGDVVVNFDLDPGAVVAGDFTLTINGASAPVTGVIGTGNTRTLDTSTVLASDAILDNVAVAATAGTNAGNEDFYAYPSISLIQTGTITPGTVVGIRGTATAKVGTPAEGSGPEYAIQDADGGNNGIHVEDAANVASVVVGNAVEVVGSVAESFNNTIISSVSSFTDLGAGAAINPVVVPAADFQATNTNNTAPAEQYEGVLIRVNGLTTAADGANGETDFSQGVTVDGLFYDARTAGTIVDGSNYDIIGIGYYSFNEYKILPRSAADVVTTSSITDWSILD